MPARQAHPWRVGREVGRSVIIVAGQTPTTIADAASNNKIAMRRRASNNMTVICVSALASCLLMLMLMLTSSADGSLRATGSCRLNLGGGHRAITFTSTWQQLTSSSRLLRPPPTTSHGHGVGVAFAPMFQRTEATPSLRSSRLAFMSTLLGHRPPAGSHQTTYHHHLHPVSTESKRPLLHRFLSLSESSDDSNVDATIEEECSLQRIYQQAKDEDSEWYYQTFSKLLDEVEPTIPPCDGAAGENKNDGGVDGPMAGKVAGMKNEGDEDFNDVQQIEDNAPDKTEGRGALDEISANLITKEVVSTSDNIAIGQSNEPQELNEVRIEHAEDGPLESSPRGDSFDDETNGEDGGSHSRNKKSTRDSYDDDDNISSGNEYGWETTRQTNPPRATFQPQKSSPATTLKSLPPVVQLRNTYTNEIERLSPLTELLDLGYSEKELIVLRPQVLELIVEDYIPRPEKGLPKKWVRLSKLNGYEDEVDDENDEDADWEVEVVAVKTSKNKGPESPLGSQVGSKADSTAVTEKGGGNSTKEVEEREFEPLGDESDEIIDLDEHLHSEGLGESGKPLPFTSLRISEDDSNSDAGQLGVARENDEGKQQHRQQQPLEAEGNVSFSREDTIGREEAYARRPQPKARRRRHNLEEYDEPLSYSSPPQSSRRGDQQRQRRRRRPPLQRRELQIDRGSYAGPDDPPPNKFWMDLPTFRDFLRKEAQLRLKILGPDWKESVLDESRWRYDLYKTWLTMLDEGVGDNPLYEYGERPRRRQPSGSGRAPPRGKRRKDRSPQMEQRTQRRRQGREFDEDDYDPEDYERPKVGKQPSPTPRPRSRRRSETEFAEDQYDLEDYERPKVGKQASTTPQPRSRGTWKNFSDLEESLQRSSLERSDLPYQDSDEGNVDLPRRRRRRPTNSNEL